jgi:arginine decarboxylase
VILATKLGRTIIPVVENFAELELILRTPDAYGVRPRIGVRVKLSSAKARAAGATPPARNPSSACSSPRSSKLVEVLRSGHARLPAARALPPGQPAAGHPPRQGSDQRARARLRRAVKLLGAGLKYIDVGGGLGVDYDGSGTNFESSMNYTLVEYANDVVYRDRERLQRARHRASDDRQRIRPRDRGITAC